MSLIITAAAGAAIASAAHKQATPPVPTVDTPTSAAQGSGTLITSSNSFNPAISLVTDFRSNISNSDRSAKKETLLKEAELGIAADVDPFLRAEFYIAFAREDGQNIAEVEEGFGRYTNLGRGLSAKFGKIAGAVGRVQRNHADQLNFLDYPLVIQDFLGDEGLRTGGASLSYLFPGDRFNEITAEVLQGEEGNVIRPSHTQDLVYIAHYRTFFDFNEDNSAQLGATYLSAPGENKTRGDMYGIDFVYKSQPGAQRSLVFESEAFWAKPGMPNQRRAFGAFAAATYQFMPTMFAYGKYDYSEIPGTNDRHQGWTVGLTLKPTEFHHWRVEFQQITSNFGASRNTLNLQFQMVIGAHPAHKY